MFTTKDTKDTKKTRRAQSISKPCIQVFFAAFASLREIVV